MIKMIKAYFFIKICGPASAGWQTLLTASEIKDERKVVCILFLVKNVLWVTVAVIFIESVQLELHLSSPSLSLPYAIP